jgi:hypothetical protein
VTRDDGPLGFDGEEEAPAPAPPPARREQPARPDFMPAGGSGRTGWIVGTIAVLVLLYIGLNTLRNHGSGPGSRGPKVGTQARAFAAPLAAGPLKGAVDVATKPGQGEAGKVPACELHLPGAYNVCDDWARGPVAVVFFAEPIGACVDQLETIDRVLPRHPRVRVVAVSIRGKRSAVADLVRSRGLGFPVVFDEDGRLANLYSVAVCPQITYLRRGGRVAGTNIGELSAVELEAQLRALERGRAPVTD